MKFRGGPAAVIGYTAAQACHFRGLPQGEGCSQVDDPKVRRPVYVLGVVPESDEKGFQWIQIHWNPFFLKFYVRRGIYHEKNERKEGCHCVSEEL